MNHIAINVKEKPKKKPKKLAPRHPALFPGKAEG